MNEGVIEPLSQNIIYQWHQEEKKTNHSDITYYKPTKSKIKKQNRSLFHNVVITMPDRIH